MRTSGAAQAAARLGGTVGARRLALFALLGGALACGDGGPSTPSLEDALSPVAAAYLNAALDLMEAHSVRRYEMDWTVLREYAFRTAAGAVTEADTYGAIQSALAAIGDGHSRFIPAGMAVVDTSIANPEPTAMVLDGLPGVGGRFGYVSVPAFSGGGAPADALATTYHRLIEGVDTLGVCAWIVDLRGNTGGNMWPMVAGLGPILGDGVLGYFIDPDSVVDTWTYADGASALDGTVLARADSPYELLEPDPPVAVLADQRTGSSGEATFIAFKGRPESWSSGVRTYGLTTANRGFALSDGAILVLAVSRMADRTGRRVRRLRPRRRADRGRPEPGSRDRQPGSARDGLAGRAGGLCPIALRRPAATAAAAATRSSPPSPAPADTGPAPARSAPVAGRASPGRADVSASRTSRLVTTPAW